MSNSVTGPVVVAVLHKAWQHFGNWRLAGEEERAEITRWVMAQCAHLNAHPEDWPGFKANTLPRLKSSGWNSVKELSA